MRKKSFLKNLISFLIPLFIPILLLGALSIIITQEYIKNDIETGNVNLLTQTKQTVELMLNELDSLYLQFGNNSEMIVNTKKILNSSKYSFEDYKVSNTIKFLLNAPSNSKPYIHSVYTYFNNSDKHFITTTNGVVSLDSFYDVSWYESYLKQDKDIRIWTEQREVHQYSFEKKPLKVITIYMKLYSSGMETSDGLLVMNLRQSYMEGILNTLSTLSGQSLLVVNEKNDIVLKNSDCIEIKNSDIKEIVQNEDTNFFLKMQNSNSNLVSLLRSDKFSWKFISIIPHDELYKIPIMLFKLTSFLLFISFLLGLSLTYYLTKKNHKHIYSIISIIESAERELPLPSLPSKIKDEYAYIVHNILKTFIEQSYLKIQLSEKKYKLQAMELLALQSQMNPHFLFNTLETIYWKTFSFNGKPNELSYMIENLSDILKYSLGGSSEKVTLEEEIRYAMSYLEIQKVRYRSKFDVVWKYDENAIKHYKVIKLLLQPLIENSIYHGIKEKDGKSKIKIRVDLKQSFLRISVIDSGMGITSEKMEIIRANLKELKENSEHIGLYNTNKRLILTYGEPWGIKILSKEGLGTAVYVFIPLP